MKRLSAVIVFTLTIHFAIGQGQDPPPPTGNSSSALSPSLNLNFAGGKSAWSNINPVVFYGFTVAVAKVQDKKYTKKTPTDTTKSIVNWDFQVGPYLGSQLSIKDNTSYLPALMLPGSGLVINNFFTFFGDRKLKVIIAPANFGVKVISGFTDSSISIVQHNVRSAIALSYLDKFQISCQLTNGWHDLTTSSQTYFNENFKQLNSHVVYLNISAQGLITNLSATNSNPLYFDLTWQNFLTKGYSLPNSRFLSFGLISSIDFKSGNNPAAAAIMMQK